MNFIQRKWIYLYEVVYMHASIDNIIVVYLWLIRSDKERNNNLL